MSLRSKWHLDRFSRFFVRITHVTNSQTERHTDTQTTLRQGVSKNSPPLALPAVPAMCAKHIVGDN